MEPVDPVPRGYRFLPSAEELVVDYLANWVAGAPLPGRAVAFADVYGTEPWNLLGSDRQEGYFFAERKPKSSGGSRVDRKAGTGSWTLNKKQDSVTSVVGGREMVVGRKSYLSFNDGRRKNSGWSMYEYEMSSSGFQRRVLCHVRKNSHLSGGTTIKTVDSTFTEAASVTEAISGGTTIDGGSFVGQKRNREESSTLSKKPSTFTEAVSVAEAVSGGTTIDGGSFVGQKRNREESSTLSKKPSTFTEAFSVAAVSVTEAISGGSFVGQKRNREESSPLSKKPCWGLVAHSSRALPVDVSPPPTAVVQHPSLVVQHPSLAPAPPESHLSSVDSVAPNEAGVPPDVGGGQLVISTEELEAFLASSPSSVVPGGEQNCTGDAFLTREVEAWTTIPKASPPGLVDLLWMPDNTRSEQMYCTDGHFFTSLQQVRAFMMSDGAQPALPQGCS